MTFGISLLVTPAARADAPFTAWAEGVSSAAAALAAGEPGEALHASRAAATAITSGEASARAGLLVARALEADRRPAEAADAIRAAVDGLPARLRPAARARMATVLLAAGRPTGAAEAWALAARDSDPAERPALAAAEARAWLAAGEPAAAARAAAPAADAGDLQARLALARAWSALADPRAPPALRALAVERAGEPEGEAAARLLLATAPSTLGLQDRLDRARSLVASGRPGPALAELDALDPAIAASPLGVVLRAMAHIRLGQPAEAERLAAPVARLPGPGEPAAARYVLARAAARQGRVDDAVARYREVARERPVVPGLSPGQQATLADDAAYLAAWLPYDAGHLDEAASGLRRYLRDRPTARRASDARWFLAWIQVRKRDLPAARSALREVASREPGGLRAAALYWLARLEPDGERSAAGYREAAAEVPGGYYALLAAARLERMQAAPSAPEPALPPSALPEPPRDPRLAASLALAVDLAAAGLREDAQAILQRLSRGPDVRARAALVAEAAAFCGDPEIPHRIARDLLPPGIRARRWSYPDAHTEVLRPAARRTSLDPALALAVMRRESAFDADVRSAADAEGLLQMRPATAHRMGALLGIPDDPDLSDPSANLPLGVAYLALLGDRFASPAQALAAYNAGPLAAAAWARTGAGLTLDEWVEDIPYRETRQYVRGVIADWARYRRLDGSPPPPIDPATVLPVPGPGVAF